MTKQFCPLSMMGGNPTRCVETYDDNHCRYCPSESLSVAAHGLRDGMHDLVSVINEKDCYDSNTGIEGAIADVAETLESFFLSAQAEYVDSDDAGTVHGFMCPDTGRACHSLCMCYSPESQGDIERRRHHVGGGETVLVATCTKYDVRIYG